MQEGLARTAQDAGQNARFEQLKWTGKNRASARQTAASDILKLVQSTQLASPNEKIFLIGHSHGGSAIAYFLKQHPAAANTLSGCAFLSTPFIAMRPRTQTDRLPFVVCYLNLLFFMIWPPFSFGLRGLMGYWPALVLVVALFGGLFLFWGAMFNLRSQNIPRHTEQAIKQQTADIPDGNYLFLRCSGDEAAAVLSAAQFIAWLGTRISQILGWLTPRLSRKFGDIVYLILTTLVVPFLTLLTFRFGLLSDLADAIHDLLFWGYTFNGAMRIIVILLLMALPCLFILCLFAAVVVLFTQAFICWAFGWARLAASFLIDFAIEPLPFGEHSLVHINWSGGPVELNGIVHSWTYAHPVAIQFLQDWVKRDCRKDLI